MMTRRDAGARKRAAVGSTSCTSGVIKCTSNIRVNQERVEGDAESHESALRRHHRVRHLPNQPLLEVRRKDVRIISSRLLRSAISCAYTQHYNRIKVLERY